MNGLIEVARLINTCAEIRGRKKLQKIVHILQCFGHPFREEFGYLHFGPYSAQLRSELDQLKRLGLIEETSSNTDVMGYPELICRATPKLGDQLQQFGLNDVPTWAPTVEQLNGLETPLLEAMSTVLFLQARGFKETLLNKRFGELKPALFHRFDDAMNHIDSLRSQHMPTSA